MDVNPWTIEERRWQDPDGAKLRARQQDELAAHHGGIDHEPGGPPSADDVDVFVLAVDSSRNPIGCGALRTLDGRTAEVKRMYVAPEARGSGLATSILRTLENAAIQRGHSVIRLETGKKMPAARRFYEREGYTLVPNFGVYRGAPLSVCYERNMTPQVVRDEPPRTT